MKIISIAPNKPSIFQNIELNETINLNRLNQLIKSDALQKIEQTNANAAYNHPNAGEYENEKHHLEAMAKRIRNDKLQVSYKKAGNNYGRTYASKALSLGSLRKPIRHTLCHDIYTDIDIENCHPQLLKQVCEANGIQCKFLTVYVENRPAILAQVQAYYNVSRDDAKNLFIRLAYFGSFNNWIDDVKAESKPPLEFITSYINELKIIGQHVINANSDLHKAVLKEKKRNVNASTVSLFLQEIERQMLELIYEYLSNNKFIQNRNCVLCYDGIMIESKFYKPEILDELHDHVLNVSGFDLKFTTKDMNEIIVLPPLPVDTTSFEYMAQEFNKTHCKAKNMYIKSNGLDIEFLCDKKLRETYKQKFYKNANGQKANFINSWTTNNDNIRVYDNMDIFPNADKCPTDTYNLWVPFACETYTEPYEHHLDTVLHLIKNLCGNEPPVFNYICKWIGQMIAFPEVKSIVPTFISKQGAGKGSLLKLLSKMLGAKKVIESTNPERDIWGQFNTALMDSFLICQNELSKKDTTQAEGKIKGLITDPTIMINRKGIDQIQIKSYHRFIITTNSTEPINTSKDDRRNLIIRCSDDLINSKKYFNKLYEYLDDTNVIRTCYDYFKNLGGLATFKNLPIPKTSYQNELKKLSLSPLELYLQHLAETIYHQKKSSEILDTEFFDGLQTFCEENNITYDITPQKLGVRLTNLNTGAVSKRIHKSGGVYAKSFNWEKLRELYCEDDDVFVDDDEKDVKPVIINKITNNTNCTINNLTDTKKAVIFNETKTAKVKDTIKKRNKFEISFGDEDDDDE